MNKNEAQKQSSEIANSTTWQAGTGADAAPIYLPIAFGTEDEGFEDEGTKTYAPAHVRNTELGVHQTARLMTVSMNEPTPANDSYKFGYQVSTFNNEGHLVDHADYSGWSSKESAEKAMFGVADNRLVPALAVAIIEADRTTNGIQETGWVGISRLSDFVAEYAPQIADNFEDEYSTPDYEYQARIKLVDGEPVVQTMGYDHDDDAYGDSNDPLNRAENESHRSYMVLPDHQGEFDELVREVKNKLHFPVERYSHSSDHYSVSGTGIYADRRWDLSSVVGIYVPGPGEQKEYRALVKGGMDKGEAAEKFVKMANSALNEFSEWANGEVYCPKANTYNSQGELVNDDSSNGYIGYEYADSAVEEMADDLLNAYTRETRAVTSKEQIVVKEVAVKGRQADISMEVSGKPFSVTASLGTKGQIEGFATDKRANGLFAAMDALNKVGTWAPEALVAQAGAAVTARFNEQAKAKEQSRDTGR